MVVTEHIRHHVYHIIQINHSERKYDQHGIYNHTNLQSNARSTYDTLVEHFMNHGG